MVYTFYIYIVFPHTPSVTEKKFPIKVTSSSSAVRMLTVKNSLREGLGDNNLALKSRSLLSVLFV